MFSSVPLIVCGLQAVRVFENKESPFLETDSLSDLQHKFFFFFFNKRPKFSVLPAATVYGAELT